MLKVKVKVLPITGHWGVEGDRGIALPFHDLGSKMGWAVSTTLGRFTPGKGTVPIVQEAW
jgi:hypothetical protein